MIDRNKTQLGYFIDFRLWQDALELLNFQIKQKQTNRHFNTLSMFYYEVIDPTCLNLDAEKYFETRISSNLFYGLKKEFAILSYVIPKQGLGLRDYKFFTYPMRVVYYAVGLYLLKLSQDFLTETYKKVKNIEAFYGGNLSYKSDKLQVTSKNIYYRNFHKQFKLKIKQEITFETQDKVVLRLDIENYSNELTISRLLLLLNHFIKPSVKASMAYDIFTRDQIICLFQFMANGKSGIPQADNNIMSSFIGYLYLVFGDLFIDEVLINNSNVIDSHKIIRYTDDIYISITFKKYSPERARNIYLLNSISNCRSFIQSAQS